MSAPADALPHRHRPGTARAALAYRDFRLIWLGLFASNIGTWMQNFTLPAYVEHRTGSAALVGLLVFTQLGPLLLLSIPAGVLADRFPRRPYLVVMQAMQLVFSVVLAALVAGDAPLWTLFATSLVIGIANALNAPAFQASVPLLVDAPTSPGAVSLNSVMINASRVLGPALAAVLALAGVSTSQLFLVNAATYLFLIAALFAVHVPDVRGTHPEHGWRRLLTGINIARGRPVLARCLVTMCVFCVVCLVYVGLFPSVVRRNFGHRRRQHRLQAAVHHVGRRRLPRRPGRRHRAGRRRPPAPGRRRDAAVRRQPRRLRRRPHARSGVPRGLRPRLRLLPDGDVADHDLPGEPGRHRAGQS